MRFVIVGNEGARRYGSNDLSCAKDELEDLKNLVNDHGQDKYGQTGYTLMVELDSFDFAKTDPNEDEFEDIDFEDDE